MSVERIPPIRITRLPSNETVWLALGVAASEAEFIYAATNLGIYAPPCAWLVITSPDAVGVVCLYKNYRIFPFGDWDLVKRGLASIADTLPDEITIVTSGQGMVPDGYTTVGQPTIEKRMYLRAINRKPPLTPMPAGIAIRPLGEDDIPHITALMTPPPDGPDADTYMQGVYVDERRLKGDLPYVGAFSGQSLIGIVGTHGLAPDLGIAVIGDAFTRPEWRNQGLATHLTSELLQQLIKEHPLHAIGTDIRDDKQGFRVLENLGFTQTGTIQYQKARRIPHQ